MNTKRFAGFSLWAVLSLVGVAAGQVPGDPGRGEQTDPRKLYETFIDRFMAKEYDQAIEIGRKILAISPNHIDTLYNMACAYSLKGDKDNACQWLDKSVEAGFMDARHLRGDSDFDNIRDTECYKRILEAAEKKKAAAREAARKAGNPVLFIAPDRLDNSKPAPLIVALHPYASNARQFAAVWQDAAAEAGAVIAAPRGHQPVSDGIWSWGDPDIADDAVLDAIEQAKAKYNIDSKRIVLTGFSQGGYITYMSGLRHTDLICGIIPVAGSFADEDPKTIEEAGKRKLKAFIMVGEDDRVLSMNQQAKAKLEAAGVDVKFNSYAGVAHAFPPNRLEEQRKALAFVLPKP